MIADLIIFDLDGTLVDSRRDIATSVNETLRHFGVGPLPEARIATFVGMGAPVLMQRVIAATGCACALDEVLARFMEVYLAHACETTQPYPGVVEALDALAPGRVLTILTNKPAPQTRAVLERLNLSHRFRAIVAANGHPVARKPDPAGVRWLLDQTSVPPSRALLVGDSRIDIETGRNANVATCGVTYGFSAPDEIAGARPDLIVDDLRELPALLI